MKLYVATQDLFFRDTFITKDTVVNAHEAEVKYVNGLKPYVPAAPVPVAAPVAAPVDEVVEDIPVAPKGKRKD